MITIKTATTLARQAIELNQVVDALYEAGHRFAAGQVSEAAVLLAQAAENVRGSIGKYNSAALDGS